MPASSSATPTTIPNSEETTTRAFEDLARENERLRSLLGVIAALSAELSLDALLDGTVEAAADLTGARYAALGVFDPAGRLLERFIAHGIDAELQGSSASCRTAAASSASSSATRRRSG